MFMQLLTSWKLFVLNPLVPLRLVQGMDDLQVRAAATDIFSYLVEFSPSMVREFVMQEPQQTDDVSLARPLLRWTRLLSRCRWT